MTHFLNQFGPWWISNGRLETLAPGGLHGVNERKSEIVAVTLGALNHYKYLQMYS